MNGERAKLFADTVARFDEHGRQWHLMNRQDRGWGERSIPFNSILEITQGYDVKLGERGKDRYGEFVRVLMDHDDTCDQRVAPSREPLQRNALRIETFAPSPRCTGRPKLDLHGKPFEVLRWVASGGNPAAVAYPCFGRASACCPKRLPSGSRT